MKETLHWSAQASPGIDIAGLNIEEANLMIEAAGHPPLDRGALNALHRAGWHTADVVVHGEKKELLYKGSIGPKRIDLIDAWRSNLLRLLEPEAEPMSIAERVVVNLMRRKVPETQATALTEVLGAIRDGNHTESLREYLVELALLVPPGRAYSSELRDWLLEVARG